MGKNKDERNQEDLVFISHNGIRQLFEDASFASQKTSYLAHIKGYISERNKGRRWGWKDPIVSYYIHDIFNDLVKPCYILIQRDASAIAQREHLSEENADKRFYAYLNRCLNEYQKLVLFCAAARHPTLVVSYERSLRYPEETVEAIVRFLHLTPAPHEQEEAIRYIVPDRRTGEKLPEALSAETPVDMLLAVRAITDYALRSAAISVQSWHQTHPLHQTDHAALVTLANDTLSCLNEGLLTNALAGANDGLYSLSSISPIAALPPFILHAVIENSVDLPLLRDDMPLLLIFHYILGMTKVQTGNPKDAISHFSCAYALSSRLLLSGSSCTWASNTIWSSLFHKAFAAKMLGDFQTVDTCVEEMQAHSISPLSLRSRTEADVQRFLKRAEVELF